MAAGENLKHVTTLPNSLIANILANKARGSMCYLKSMESGTPVYIAGACETASAT